MAENNNIPQFVNSDSFMVDKNYVKWLSNLKKRFHMAQLKAAVKVSRWATIILRNSDGLRNVFCT